MAMLFFCIACVTATAYQEVLEQAARLQSSNADKYFNAMRILCSGKFGNALAAPSLAIKEPAFMLSVMGGGDTEHHAIKNAVRFASPHPLSHQ